MYIYISFCFSNCCSRSIGSYASGCSHKMYKKNHDKLISAISFFEFPQVQYIDIQSSLWKADIIVTSLHVIKPLCGQS